MLSILELYIIFSVFTGLLYFVYWYRNLMTPLVEKSGKMKYAVYLVVIVFATVGAPISMGEMIYKNFKVKSGGIKK